MDFISGRPTRNLSHARCGVCRTRSLQHSKNSSRYRSSMPRRSSQVFCNPCAHRFDLTLKESLHNTGSAYPPHPQPAVARAQFAQPQKRRNEDVYTMTPHSINPAYQGVIRRSVESAEMNRGMTNSGLGRCGAYRTPSHRPSRNWIRFRSSRPLPSWAASWRLGSNRAPKAERCRAGQDGDLLARPECLRRVPVRYSPIWINTTALLRIYPSQCRSPQNFFEGTSGPFRGILVECRTCCIGMS